MDSTSKSLDSSSSRITEEALVEPVELITSIVPSGGRGASNGDDTSEMLSDSPGLDTAAPIGVANQNPVDTTESRSIEGGRDETYERLVSPADLLLHDARVHQRSGLRQTLKLIESSLRAAGSLAADNRNEALAITQNLLSTVNAAEISSDAALVEQVTVLVRDLLALLGEPVEGQVTPHWGEHEAAELRRVGDACAKLKDDAFRRPGRPRSRPSSRPSAGPNGGPSAAPGAGPAVHDAGAAARDPAAGTPAADSVQGPATLLQRGGPIYRTGTRVGSIRAPAREAGNRESRGNAAHGRPSQTDEYSYSILMPHIGESVTEGTITGWLRGVDDDVDVDEPFVEVSTDKVDAEIPTPCRGTIVWLAATDDAIAVGDEIAMVRLRCPVCATAKPSGQVCASCHRVLQPPATRPADIEHEQIMETLRPERDVIEMLPLHDQRDRRWACERCRGSLGCGRSSLALRAHPCVWCGAPTRWRSSCGVAHHGRAIHDSWALKAGLALRADPDSDSRIRVDIERLRREGRLEPVRNAMAAESKRLRAANGKSE